MDSIFATAGEWLANLYILYGLFFLAGGSLFCVHVLVLIFVCRRRDPRRFAKALQLIEIVYGLVNPLIYLLFLQRPFELRRDAVLTGIGWAVLLGVWSVRLWGGFALLRRSTLARHVAQVLLGAALLCIVAFLVKDFPTARAHASAPEMGSVAWWFGALYFLNTGALYAVPAASLVRLLRFAANEQTWSGGGSFFLLSPRFALASSALFGLTALLWNTPRPAHWVERGVLAERAAIMDASQRYQLDPRLIASILYVIQRDDTAPFARQLERLIMGAWIADPANDLGFAEPLDLSVGIAQIRPFTALSALVIYNTAGKPVEPNQRLLGLAISIVPAGANYKQYRGLPDLDSRWRLPASAVATLHSTFTGLPTRSQIVEDLFDDRQNLEMCGLILALYAAQWQTANPAWDIHDRPEILATLYQLGFERSQPKANPRPIKFGERVRGVYESEWMKAHFGGSRP